MLTESEVLKKAIESGILNLDTIQAEVEMNERRKYLDMHKGKIWRSTDKKWYTYLVSASGRKLVKRKTREELDEAIIVFYRDTINEPTIHDVFEWWIADKLKYGEIQKQTYDRYKVDFDKFFVQSGFDNRKIHYISELDLEKFCKTQIHTHELTNKRWANLRLILKAIFKYANRRGYTDLDIIKFLQYIELPKTIFRHTKKKASDNVFNQEEIKQIVEYCNNKPTLNNLAVLFAAYTGMRVGEIVALKWEDIKENIIYVHRTQIVYKEKGKYVHSVKDDAKTEAGNREVVIIPQLRPILHKLRMINPFTEYIFQNSEGKTILKNTICKNLHIICDNLGIKRRGVHTLRKTFITNMINGNVEEAIIIEQVGHTMIETSKAYYYYNDKLTDYMSEKIQRAISY